MPESSPTTKKDDSPPPKPLQLLFVQYATTAPVKITP
jgi:hypothetical protein